MKTRKKKTRGKAPQATPHHFGGVGGAANEAGSDFRAKVGAWLVTHALVGRRIEALELPNDLDIPTGLLMPECDMPVDDLEVQLSNGGQLYIQAKRSLDLSTKSDSEFGKTALQLSKMASIEGFSSSKFRLAVVIGESTAPLRSLQESLNSLRKTKSAILSEKASETLEILKNHFKHLQKKQSEEILKATVFIFLDLANLNSSTKEACIARLSQVVQEGHQELAWLLLIAKVKELSVHRVGLSLDGWVEFLQQGKVVVNTKPDGPPAAIRACVLNALQKYKESTISRGSEVSLYGFCGTLSRLKIEPTTKGIQAAVGPTQVQLSWLVRRLGKVLLLGMPGVGKSTALKRLAAEISSLKIAPLPLFVSLPQFVDSYSKTKNPLEELVRLGTESTPAPYRSFIYNEILKELRNTGRAIILLDSLDECRHCRDELIQTLRTAFAELHPAVEIIVATRDSTYAHSSSLGFHEATLEPPKDLPSTLKLLAMHLAEEQKVPTENRKGWVRSLLTAVDKHKEKVGSFHQTPLALTTMLIIASEQGPQILVNGRANTLSKLVNRLARGWEIEHRRKGNVEISQLLCREESADFVLQVFDFVAYLLDENESISKEDLLSRISAWAQKDWGLPPARALSAASNAVKFWDDSGIFVASGSHDLVRARYATLQEIGVARWLTRSDQKENRKVWLDQHFLDPNRAEALVFLAGLNLSSAKQLTDHAQATKDRKLALLMGRAFSEIPLCFPEKDRAELIRSLIDSLLPHLAEGHELGWEILTTIFKLPLTQEIADKILSAVQKTFDKVRSDRVEAILDLILHPLEEIKLPHYLELLKTGPMPTFAIGRESKGNYLTIEDLRVHLSIDPLLSFLALHLASKIGPDFPDLARALLMEGRISADAHLEIIQSLEKFGYQKIMEEVANAKNDIWSSTRHKDWLKESQESDDNLFQIISTLGKPKVDYYQRRRCSELADFWATVIPGDLPAHAVQFLLLKHPDFVSYAMRLATKLGGFPPEVLAGQIIASREEGFESNLYLYFAGEEKKLGNWPPGEERITLLNEVLKLFSGTVWTSRLAALSLTYYPVPAEAAAAIQGLMPKIKDPSSRRYAAFSLLNLSPDNIAIAQKWLTLEDPMLVHVAAISIATMFQNGKISLDFLSPVLLKTDIAVREDVQKQLAGVKATLELDSLLQESRSLPAGPWSCIWCGQTGIEPNRSACSKCNVCR